MLHFKNVDFGINFFSAVYQFLRGRIPPPTHREVAPPHPFRSWYPFFRVKAEPRLSLRPHPKHGILVQNYYFYIRCMHYYYGKNLLVKSDQKPYFYFIFQKSGYFQQFLKNLTIKVKLKISIASRAPDVNRTSACLFVVFGFC